MGFFTLKEIDPAGAAGVVLGLYAIWRQSRTEKRQDLERKADSARAQVSVVREADKLVIRNDGPGHAFDVYVQLDNRSIQQHPAVFNPSAPIPALAPGGEFSYTLLVDQAISPFSGAIVKLRWVDDAGRPGHLTTTVR